VKNSISIIIPILNEKKNLKKLIDSIKTYLKKKRYEIIFVDDNSDDFPALVIKKYKSAFIRHILRNNCTRDLSKSCFLGIEESKYKNILIMDGDLQHDPIYINLMTNLYFKNNYDFVIASRNFDKIINLSNTRLFASKIITKIFSFFLEPKLVDPMSGFFIFKKKIYLKNKNKLFGKGYKILADLIFSNKNFRFKEVEIKFAKRFYGKSKINFKILVYIILLLLNKIKLKYSH